MSVSFGKAYHFLTQTFDSFSTHCAGTSGHPNGKPKLPFRGSRVHSNGGETTVFMITWQVTSSPSRYVKFLFFLAWIHMIRFGLTILKGETGKLVVFGFDIKGRPIFYMIPSRQNTEESPRQMQYTVWFLERCIDLMPPGTEYVLSHLPSPMLRLIIWHK